MPLGVATRVDLVEVTRLDPHPLALEQPEDAGLPRLGPFVPAVATGERVVLLVRLGLLVGGDVSLVVPQHDLVVRVADQVIRHHRDLAAAAGCVDDVCRHRIARRVAPQALHDLEALAHRRPEVPRSLDEIALVDVVGPDPVLHQAMHEGTLDVHAVVHAGLVAERDAGPGELVGGPADLGRDLVRMIEVEVDPDRVVALKHVAQLVVHPLWKEDRDA